MTYDTNREWRIVLFPPYALLVFMLLTLPPALILGFVWSANAGYILMMLTPIYYLNYETFHLCCHVHDNWFVRNCPLVNTIRRHHAAHHSQPIMMERNMNLTYPVADWYMGTSDLDRGLARPSVQRLQHQVRQEGVPAGPGKGTGLAGAGSIAAYPPGAGESASSVQQAEVRAVQNVVRGGRYGFQV